MKTKIVLLVALLFAASSSQAAPDSFSCVVKNQSTLQKDGAFSVQQVDRHSPYFDQRFVVDKVSGRVSGKLFYNEGAEQITVLDNGINPENAFHIHWRGRKDVSAPFFYLYIESFIKPRSPFVWIRGGESFSGLCD